MSEANAIIGNAARAFLTVLDKRRQNGRGRVIKTCDNSLLNPPVLFSIESEADNSIVTAVMIDNKQRFLDVKKNRNLIMLQLLYSQFDKIDIRLK